MSKGEKYLQNCITCDLWRKLHIDIDYEPQPDGEKLIVILNIKHGPNELQQRYIIDAATGKKKS